MKVETWDGRVNLPLNRSTGSVRATNLTGAQARGVPVIDMPVLPEAACKGSYDKSFHPSTPSAKTANAKRVCMSCPVRQKCLDWALQWEWRNGQRLESVWGGLSQWERAELDFVGEGPRLCRNRRHEMVEGNLLRKSDGGETCRACDLEADAIRRAATKEAKAAL